MSSKRIEQAIEEIYTYIEECRPKGFSNTQIIVNKEELLDKLDEMKLRIPDEVGRCTKLLERRDEILRDAELKAQKIIEEAQMRAEALVHDSEIMRQAYVQANDYVSRATQEAQDAMNLAAYEADQIRTGAYEYTKEKFELVENVLSATLTATKVKYEEYVNALTKNLEIVMANRKELTEEIAPVEDDRPIEDQITEEDDEPYQDQGLFATDDDDFQVGSDIFLKNVE